MTASLPRAFAAAALLALAAAPQARAGHYEDGVYIPDGVCVDPQGCGSSSSSDSDAFRNGPPSIAWGKMLNRASERVSECGTNPVCKVVRGALLYPLGLAFDAPVLLVKGLATGGYYTAKGLYYGGRGVGRGIAATGRAVAAPFNRPSKPPSTWEAYKRQVLALQRRLTKVDPRSKPNSDPAARPRRRLARQGRPLRRGRRPSSGLRSRPAGQGPGGGDREGARRGAGRAALQAALRERGRGAGLQLGARLHG